MCPFLQFVVLSVLKLGARSVYGADPDLTPPQWISVLRLAKMWNFENMEETAYDGLRTITQTDPVHAIQIARDFNIHDLIDPSIWVLAFRENLSITDDEHAILGPDLVQRIKQTRQNAWLQSQLYGHVYNQNTGTMIPPERDDFEGTNVIQQIEELRLH